MSSKVADISLILLAVSLLTVTQLVIKGRLNFHGEIPLNPTQLPAYILLLLRDWCLWLALFSLIASALSWYAGISRLPLSVAFPITALSYPLIFAGSILFLGEEFEWISFLGNTMIFGGILIISLNH